MKGFPCVQRLCVTVEPVLFLYMMAMFLEFSVFQNLIYTKLCVEEIGTSHDYAARCKNLTGSVLKTVDAGTTKWGRYHQLLMGLTSLFACLYIGSWSDKFGRKIPMLIQPLGSILASLSTIFSASFLHANLGYLLISSFFSGICGASSAFIANCFGYLSDITNETTRTKRLTILESMLFVGGTAGFYVAGYLQKVMHLTYIFLIISIIHMILTFYIVFILPDLKPQRKTEVAIQDVKEKEDEHSLTFRELFNLEHFLGILVTVFRSRENNKRTVILILLIASLLLFCGVSVQSSLVFPYVRNEPLKWDESLYSYYSGLVFALQGLGLIVIMPILHLKQNIPDTGVVLFGICSRVLGLFLLGISTTTVMAFACATAFTCSELCLPALRSMLSKIVDCDEKGRILSFMTMLQTVSFLIGALVFNSLYLATMDFFPGFTFELVAGIQVIAMGLVLLLHFKMKNVYIPMEEDIGDQQDGVYT